MMKNQLKWGALLSYLQMAANMVVTLLFTPIMLRLLGTSEYGLYNTVSSTISMLSILNLGFNSSYIRFYSKYKSQNDQESIKKLNGLFLTIFMVMGIVAFLCSMYLAFNLDIVFKDGLTETEYKIAQTLMILLSFNLAVSFPSSVFKSIISAQERYIFLKLVHMLNTLCGPLVSIPLLFAGIRSVGMVAVLVLFHLIADVLLFYYAVTKCKARFAFGKIEKGLFGNLLFYTVFIAMNMIVDQINWNMGKVILGRYRGTMAVSIFSLGYTISTAYNMFSTSISGVFTPRIHKIVNTTTDRALRSNTLTALFVKVGRIQFLILGLVSSGLVFFGKQFITQFWAGTEFSEAYYVTLLLVIPVTIPLIQNIGIEVQRALNKHYFRSIVYLIMALINIIISVVLCQTLGATGAAIGTAASLILANGLVMNIYYHKKCDINILEFWKNILSMAKGFIIPILSGLLLVRFIDTTTLWGFGGAVLIYTVIYGISMWFLATNAYEKGLVIASINKILHRKSK